METFLTISFWVIIVIMFWFGVIRNIITIIISKSQKGQLIPGEKLRHIIAVLVYCGVIIFAIILKAWYLLVLGIIVDYGFRTNERIDALERLVEKNEQEPFKSVGQIDGHYILKRTLNNQKWFKLSYLTAIYLSIIVFFRMFFYFHKSLIFSILIALAIIAVSLVVYSALINIPSWIMEAHAKSKLVKEKKEAEKQ